MSRTRFRLTSCQHPFSLIQRLLALLTCMLYLGTSIPAVAASPDATGGKLRAKPPSSHKPYAPHLAFTSPTFGATTSGPRVKIALQLSGGEDSSTLKVKLNGHDISSRFHSDSCTGGSCSMSAEVAIQDGLRQGENRLLGMVHGHRNSGAGEETLRFAYRQTLSDSGNIEQYLPPAIGFTTVNAGGGSPWIQITTGTPPTLNDPLDPTANSLPYPDTTFATTCESVLQVLVLDRTNPTVKKDYQCENSTADLISYLAGLDSTDLVIVGTTPTGGAMPSDLDTSSIGGTNFAAKSFSGGAAPQLYMVIGVPGATAGTAYENYDLTATSDAPHQYWPFLNGTLELDTNGYYNFMPGDERTFSVSSGTGSTPASVTINGPAGRTTYTLPGNEFGAGEFAVLVLDRDLLEPITYSPGAQASFGSLATAHRALNYAEVHSP